MNDTIIKTHKNNLDRYYEFHIYDKNIGSYMYSNSEYAPCPIVVMSRHQGFQWNDELFVSPYRRSAGYESHKSMSLQDKDNKILSTTTKSKDQQQEIDHESPPEVIDINLTEADCDVWP
ncbi:uncharacterized protein BX663DRAFT_513033 [Cokeromyces recurvatus]|uniref:uncharacterized protein n=1 Tax=Cokeromyces recurvatus TaxID=90255 RepID=UPI00221F6A05|nr:uncharacterized protein BX663DRAFT_513033 [Cokeromyces recurvatus]KAI7901953.1 hypothetical protein BX663DRAFT_513033 [Cokeromyces recurvatus]